MLRNYVVFFALKMTHFRGICVPPDTRELLKKMSSKTYAIGVAYTRVRN